MASNGEKLDMSEIDDVFRYTAEMAHVIVKETLNALNRNTMPQGQRLKIIYNALKTNFTIEQIWERLKEHERKDVMPLLRPEEIVQLRKAGLFKVKEEKSEVEQTEDDNGN